MASCGGERESDPPGETPEPEQEVPEPGDETSRPPAPTGEAGSDAAAKNAPATDSVFAASSDEQTVNQALVVMERKCKEGNEDACTTLELMRKNASGNAPKPVPDEDPVCRSGAECLELGHQHFSGKGKPKSAKAAYDAWRQGCKLNHYESCYLQGKMKRDGVGTKRDPIYGKALLRTACRNGVFDACGSLGLSMLSTQTQQVKGVQFLEKGCKGKSAIGCHGLALAYLQGKGGLKIDRKRTKQLLDKACKLGSAPSCDAAKTLR